MDRLDEALYRLGDTQAAQAALAQKKESILALAERSRPGGARLLYGGALAAALLIGLTAGALMQRAGVFTPPANEPYVYSGMIPATDGADGQTPQMVRPVAWDEDTRGDISLAGLPTSADTRTFRLTYIPRGMTAQWDHDSGLLEVSDPDRTRSILAMLCLRYELTPEEYEGLAIAHGRARVKINEFGETGGVSWVLRLNQDVYVYVSAEGLSYEETERFVQGIQQQKGGQ